MGSQLYCETITACFLKMNQFRRDLKEELAHGDWKKEARICFLRKRGKIIGKHVGERGKLYDRVEVSGIFLGKVFG